MGWGRATRANHLQPAPLSLALALPPPPTKPPMLRRNGSASSCLLPSCWASTPCWASFVSGAVGGQPGGWRHMQQQATAPLSSCPPKLAGAPPNRLSTRPAAALAVYSAKASSGASAFLVTTLAALPSNSHLA